MSEFIFKKGNTGVINMTIKDQNGVTITNLAVATAITFELKKEETGVALFSLTLAAGDIAVDTPDAGDVQIIIPPASMAQVPQLYYCGLKIEWGASGQYEVHIFVDGIETERLRIEQNIVT